MVRLVYYRVKKILLVNMKDTCININFIEQDSRFILCFTILGLLDIEQLEYLNNMVHVYCFIVLYGKTISFR